MSNTDLVTKLNVADGVYDLTTPWVGMIKQPSKALIASGFPVKPPRAWFENPRLTELTPLSITASGYVSGHIAGWRTNHIGLSAGVKPPRSKSGYAFFMTGALETAEGDFVNVGQITLTGGHAPIEASVADAVAHYDNTKSAIMDVACGEDRHGIWVAGALRPDVTDEQLRAIRASSVSGDWRPINGRLELVAVCSVNCPGFPIPRARVASGVPVALIAAGTAPIVEKIIRQYGEESMDSSIVASLEMLNTRIGRIENAIYDSNTETVVAATQSPTVVGTKTRRVETETPGTTAPSQDRKPWRELSADEKKAFVASVRENRQAQKRLSDPENAPIADSDKAEALRAQVASIRSVSDAQKLEKQKAELRQKVHTKNM